MASIKTKVDTSISTQPVVVSDPRFRAGRTLVTSGQAARAISIFATLLEHSIAQFGDTHVESAPAYYEYGNALLRAQEQAPEQEEDPTESGKKGSKEGEESIRRNAVAAAAERRQQQSVPKPSALSTELKEPVTTNEESRSNEGEMEGSSSAAEVPKEEDDENDTQLALEMMETSWSILDMAQTQESPYKSWILEQIPRVLTGLGDVLTALGRHADAADAYLRALQHRQATLARFDQEGVNTLLLQSHKDLADAEQATVLEFLKSRRLVIETNVLIAESLLAHEDGVDVVTSESQTVLVKAADRVEYARGYYEASREELQETVVLMGQIKAKLPDNQLVEEEKENVCFVATLVMAIGISLAGLDEEQHGSLQPPKAKRVKS